jgi:hypothetical protein
MRWTLGATARRRGRRRRRRSSFERRCQLVTDNDVNLGLV